MRLAEIWAVRLVSLGFLALTLLCVFQGEYLAGVITAATTFGLTILLIRLERSLP